MYIYVQHIFFSMCWVYAPSHRKLQKRMKKEKKGEERALINGMQLALTGTHSVIMLKGMGGSDNGMS